MVERSILLLLEASSRARVFNHWVKVAVKLHELHNFQTLKAIFSVLEIMEISKKTHILFLETFIMDSTYLLAAVKTVIERDVTGVRQTTPSTTTIISSTSITINS
ncbi:hypothetical protein Glove_43g49 [Diversispora epigaea]|uniref:Ras-GEF domain-containing protein n=1 Tax=Diversispora epigaea TaxID=1348612 RepID=A0A397JQT9_9GLOM|nr:hypothetical protein Glove_43g49 [Diversispora epigaea]